MQIMALMFKLLRLNMRDIKKSTKSLINSKAMLKNVARPRFDSTVKSSKFMVKEWPSYKRPTTSSLSFLTKESRTCTHYTISSHQRTQNWPGSMKRYFLSFKPNAVGPPDQIILLRGWIISKNISFVIMLDIFLWHLHSCISFEWPGTEDKSINYYIKKSVIFGLSNEKQ